MRTVQVIGIGLDNPGARPVLLLQETDGARRVLPVWVGMPEATAVEAAARRIASSRPGTHELIAQLITRFERRLLRVSVTGLHGGVFHAELVFDADTRISARPSDAVVLAVQLGVLIEVAEEVLDQAAVDQADVLDASPGDEPASGVNAEQELDRFRRFLDTATPQDFEQN